MTIARLAVAGLTATILGSGAMAQQTEPPDVPGMMPRDLNELGSEMADRAGEIIMGEEVEATSEEPADPTLYAGSSEDPDALVEIRAIVRELDTNLSTLEQMNEMQRELINFAQLDPAAAYASRPSAEICEESLDTRFCDRLNASFRGEAEAGDVSDLMIVPVE